jgi:hypothetical protein
MMVRLIGFLLVFVATLLVAGCDAAPIESALKRTMGITLTDDQLSGVLPAERFSYQRPKRTMKSDSRHRRSA